MLYSLKNTEVPERIVRIGIQVLAVAGVIVGVEAENRVRHSTSHLCKTLSLQHLLETSVEVTV